MPRSSSPLSPFSLGLNVSIAGRCPAQGGLDSRPGLRDHKDEQHRPRGDVHLLHVLRPHRPRPHRREARAPAGPALAAHAHAVQGWAHLLHDRVRHLNVFHFCAIVSFFD